MLALQLLFFNFVFLVFLDCAAKPKAVYGYQTEKWLSLLKQGYD